MTPPAPRPAHAATPHPATSDPATSHPADCAFYDATRRGQRMKPHTRDGGPAHRAAQAGRPG